MPPGDPAALALRCAASPATTPPARRIGAAGRETYEARASETTLGAPLASRRSSGRSRQRDPSRSACSGSRSAPSRPACRRSRSSSSERSRPGRFDVGNLTQVVWSTANGRFLEMTDLNGDQISRLGAHFDPIVVAPRRRLWWLWPSPELLLVVQAVAVALGAVPVFLLARKHLGTRPGRARASRVVYLLYPPTQWLVVDDFHPVAFATPLLLAAIWFLDEERLLPFAVCAGRGVPDEGAGRARRGDARPLVCGRARPASAPAPLIFVGGAACAVVATAVIVPALRTRQRLAVRGPLRSASADRRPASSGGPSSIRYGCSRQLTEHRDLTYLLDLLVPLGGLPLLSPLLAASALPELALNLLSDTPTQTSIHFHYTAGAIPGLVAAAVLGASRRPATVARMPRPPSRRRSSCSCSAPVSCSGPLPIWPHVPFGSTLATDDHVVTAHDRAAARVLRARAARRPGQRDQHARSAPLRAAARLQLPRPARGDAGSRST